jgi:hypothetical protein
LNPLDDPFADQVGRFDSSGCGGLLDGVGFARRQSQLEISLSPKDGLVHFFQFFLEIGEIVCLSETDKLFDRIGLRHAIAVHRKSHRRNRSFSRSIIGRYGIS